MNKLFRKLYKRHPLFNFKDLNLEKRLSIVFLLTGMILSTLGTILTFAFGSPFWINVPNILCALLCFFLPIIYTDKLLNRTIGALFIVGCLYFPFLFFTNAGNAGSGPLYFIMIIIYFSFYLSGRKLIYVELFLVFFYASIMIFSYLHPNTVIPYSDKLTETIDMIVAVVSISTTISIVAFTTFREYKRERNQVSKLLDKVQTQKEKLEEVLIMDQMTCTYTKEYFTEKLIEEIEFTKAHPSTFYTMMIDIDDFKTINDTYGHLYGDIILKEVALTIKNTLRKHDIVGRYGGEEFSILITHSTDEEGKKIAQRIRQNIEKINHRYDDLITVSIGCTKNTIDDTHETILKRADDLLYKAKNNGKNQVCCK